MEPMDQSLRVVPDTLNNLIVSVGKGDYRIPQFQREYVWEKSKVISLFDSIYKEYPVGSFFLWKAAREHNRLFRHSIALNIHPIQEDDDVYFILDGQQRITSLFVTLNGLTANGTDYSRICFDVKNEIFTHREPDNQRFIRVCDIWGPKALEIVDGVEKEFKPAYRRCFETLRTYPISIVEVRDKDLPSVCRIFQRINQAGKRLDRFDLISAMTFTPEFDLREKFKKDVVAKLKQKSFGAISPVVVTQLMALVKKGACTERIEYSLTSDEIIEMWPSTVQSILLAADTLRNNVGVQNVSYLPYDAILTLLAYYFARSGKRSLPANHMEWVKKWFWRSSFGQHYGAGGPTKMGRDKELFDQLLDNKIPIFDLSLNISMESLVGTKMTWSRSAIRNAFLCLLANRGPVHLANNTKLDLVNGGISGFTSPEKHHIFPKAFLQRQGPGGADVHALPNFCFLPAELNKRILDTQPSVYFPEIEKENQYFDDAANCHLIPIDRESGILEDDYLNFLKTRSRLILDEIEHLCGLSSIPSADTRHKAIEKMERRIRDFIHCTLMEATGEEYWMKVIPNDVREGVENRIISELKKHPDRKPEYFSKIRVKLDYLNVADFVKIVANKNNWPHFESVFGRKDDLERHLGAFSEFRNSIMHSRDLTEIALKSGELSFIWLENALPPENGQKNNIHHDNDHT